MTNDEQRIIHEAAADASERLIKAANLIGLTACAIEEPAHREMLADAIDEMKRATDSLHQLFVELNKAGQGGRACWN
jgi:hypothetical protein